MPKKKPHTSTSTKTLSSSMTASSSNSLWEWLHHSIFVVILVLAFLVRFWKLGQIPFSLYWDEMAMYVDIKSVLQTGHDMFGRPWFQVIYPSYGDYKLPILIWAASAFSKVFGLSEWSLRLPSALAGVGTVAVAGWITKEFLDKKEWAKEKFAHLAQLFTMAIVAFSPWSVMFSRTGFEGHLGQFFLALSILCFLLSRKRPWLLLFVPFFGAVATYAYFSVRFVWIGVFVLTAVYIWWEKFRAQKKYVLPEQLRWKATYLLFPIILFSLLLLPMLRSPLYKDANAFRLGTDSILKNDKQVMQSNVYRELAGNSRFDRIIFHRLWLTTQELMKNYSDNLSLNFLFVSGDPNLRHGTGQYGLFVLPLLGCLLVGLFVLSQKEREMLLVLVGWWILALLPASVPENTPHALRSLNALVPLAIILGVGMAEIWIWSTQQLKQKKLVHLGAALLFLLFVLTSTMTFFYQYFTVYPQESATDWQNGYKQLAIQLDPLAQKEQVFVLPFDDRFYLWMMGYGSFTGADFQSWKSKEYKFEGSIPNMVFHEPSDSQIKTSLHLVVAGKPMAIEKFIQDSKLEHVTQTKVYGDDNTVRFVIATIIQ
jgi:4-amino-4-deoxy-L-arabinose transferase-like glycosyltransferase